MLLGSDKLFPLARVGQASESTMMLLSIRNELEQVEQMVNPGKLSAGL